MQRNPVGWFEIYVNDMARAIHFYETVFQVTLQNLEIPDIDMWAFPILGDTPGAPGALVKMKGCPAGSNSTVVYFSCEDCAEEAERVKLAGGLVIQDKFPIGEHGFVAMIQDSEENMIGLHSLK